MEGSGKGVIEECQYLGCSNPSGHAKTFSSDFPSCLKKKGKI
jgi:hypothetical protein